MYTVKKLSKISGVSIRTLHWYDKIGLLKPAYRSDKGYREYDEENLLDLQQILIFRELDIPLADVEKLLHAEGFNRLQALRRHRQTLREKAKRFKAMIKTIESTIAHIKGNETMNYQDFYDGITPEKRKEYEGYLIDAYGNQAKTCIDESKKRTVKWGKSEWADVKAEGDRIYEVLAEFLKAGEDVNSESVQTLIAEHCALMGRFYEVTKTIYIGLGELYCAHGDFREFFDRYDPKFPEYIREAMKIYAEENLA